MSFKTLNISMAKILKVQYVRKIKYLTLSMTLYLPTPHL